KILTVQDIKGLEYDSVILYDFGSEFKEHWNKIFTNKVKQNQLYRYYFNLLYVGITRARTRLLLMEKDYKNKLIENIKDSLVELTAEGRRNFTLKSGEEDFLKEGKKLLSNGLFREAISAFEKAKAVEYIKEAKIELDGENFFDKNGTEKTMNYIIENDDLLSKVLEKYVVIDNLGKHASNMKNYEKAERYYKISENHEELSILEGKKGNIELSYDYAIKSGRKELIDSMRKKVDKNKKALKVVNSIISLSDKKIKNQKLSIKEFENLSGEYIFSKQKKNIGEVVAILDGKINFKTKTEKSRRIPKLISPTKLFRKLIYVDGGKVGIKYLIENNSKDLGVKAIISSVDDGEIVDKLIRNSEKKIDLDEMLLLACEKNMLKNVKKLLDLGANIETREPQYNMTPLFIAVYYENLELVKLLVEKNADLDALRRYEEVEETVLKQTIRIENHEIFKYLIKSGANIELESPMFYAVSLEREKMVEYLIRKEVKLNSSLEGNSLLIKAVRLENFKIIKILLEAGVNLHSKEKKGTPMKRIIIQKYIIGLNLFLEKGYILDTKELQILSKINDIEMTRVVLNNYYGQNYFNKIEEEVSFYKEKKSYNSKTGKIEKLNKIQEYRYDFTRYGIGVKSENK
ncbi:MAG: ankyrin repeat domain-containing protein, partial [Psychrilyobacter sp.]|nr:ankyrin repeat domain-containing protein [Psychrilyobacter sp.]